MIMKRCIFIFAMLLCIFPSYAISKKELIYKSNELKNIILQEYKFKSNFDSISVVLQTAYNAKAKELIEKTYETYYEDRYKIGNRRVSKDEYRLYQMRNEGVGDVYIKLNDTLSLSLSGAYKIDLFWYFEGPYLLKEYPEIREIDSLLSIKKLYDYKLGPKSNNAIVSKWMENINYKPSIDDAVERYNREKIEKEARLQKEKEAKQREFQRLRAQTPKKRTFYAVKSCEYDKNTKKWDDYRNIKKLVVIEKERSGFLDYITIDYKGYYAKPIDTDKWFCYTDNFQNNPVFQANLRKKENGSYQLYLYYFEGEEYGTCYFLESFSAVRAKMNLDEWIIGKWEGNDDGHSDIIIYNDRIAMNLHQYQDVYQILKGINYYIDGNKIQTNLNNGTITIDRNNGCLYFRGVKYRLKSPF